MYVYSGKCRLCECGLKTDLKSIEDEPLRTGDIVISYTMNELGVFEYLGGLTIVVCNQWQTYSDNTHKIIDANAKAFIMGIKKVTLGERWHVSRVKKFKDVIDGESWTEFGFNYKNG